MTTFRAWLIVAGCLTAIIACSGCAGMDEHRCGGRGFHIRDGQCEGYGDNFQWKRFPPGPILAGKS